MRGLVIAGVVSLIGGGWAADRAFAQAPLDRLEAGRQSYARQEAARQEQLDRQRDVQEYVRWQAALPDRRLYYSGPADAISPAPAGPFFAPNVSPVRPGLTGPWFIDDGVFEPWPVWPGQIFGFRHDNPVEQPTGHEITWHGPNSYTYQPTYASRGSSVAVGPVPSTPPRLIDLQSEESRFAPAAGGDDVPRADSPSARPGRREPAGDRPDPRRGRREGLPRPKRLIEDPSGPREF